MSDSSPSTHRFQADRDGDNAVVTVVSAMSDVTGTPTDDLPPLYDSIPPDALVALLDSAEAGSGTRGAPLRISFTYNDHGVTATAEGTVIIERDGLETDER